MQWEKHWRPDRTTFHALSTESTRRGKDAATNTSRYEMKDVVAYVLTLCATALIVSLMADLPLDRVLGVQFVVGWFSLDACWSPESKFVRVDTLLDYGSFALGVVLGTTAWWWLRDNNVFLLVQGVMAALAAGYWVFTETPRKEGLWYRGCVRALLLYGGVTVLALVVAEVSDVDFVVHPWYVAFVLTALSATRRRVNWWDRALHGWTWAVLIEALGRDDLMFDRFFYK